MLRSLLLFFIVSGIIISCQKEMKSGLELTRMDTTIAPQEDFYQFMNGTWLKEFEIPADRSTYGTFAILREDAQKNLRGLIEEAGNKENKEPGSDEQKVGDLYYSFMDSTMAEELGIKPVNEDFDAIKNVKSFDELTKLMAYFEKINVPNPFGFGVWQDAKNSSQYIVNILQNGISLPDRDYYLNKDQKFVEIREKYLAHMEKMFDMAGFEDSAAKAKLVLKIETMLAEKQWTPVQNRDPQKTYNKLAIADIDNEMSNFNWALYAKEAGFDSQDSIRIYQLSYLNDLDQIFKTVSLDDWKTYYLWQRLTTAAPFLSANFVEEDFNFFSRTLRGTEENQPRWKRAVTSVQGALGEMVGKLYVKHYFKPEAKERMVKLVDNLKSSLKERISGLDWMSDSTKHRAYEKLSKFTTKIGYPDKWKDYSALEIKKDDLMGNLKRSSLVEFNRNLDKLGKPIDREEWVITPQTVNAGYLPNKNEIIFPAAILQPPFFNLEADDAVNYGAIGAAIGHEITHGFDDKGRQYDGDGNLKDWWTKEDNDEFLKRSKVMVNQFNGYVAIDTIHVNGELTLGENIADLGGLTVAFYAYKNSLNGKEAPIIDGFTGDQRFFLGWAQVWASKYKDEALMRQVMTDPHSPGPYRANGIVSNMPEFYTAFNVTEIDPMYRPDDIRVKIW